MVTESVYLSNTFFNFIIMKSYQTSLVASVWLNVLHGKTLKNFCNYWKVLPCYSKIERLESDVHFIVNHLFTFVLIKLLALNREKLGWRQTERRFGPVQCRKLEIFLDEKTSYFIELKVSLFKLN